MATTGSATVVLRPVTDADRDFLVGVYGSTRDEELSQVAWAPGQREAFVRMQFDAQDADYRQRNPAGSFDVVEVDGRPAGRLYVDRRPEEIRIVDIALLPEYRGAGVGGRLLGRLMDEAAASGRRLSIHVEIHNRAAELYSRLGFGVVAERGVYRLMEWRA
ncbi:GNAT family N-acetyltransferase [Nocardioides sp.]|uniref:GNAT family N-acetyltransferase n=1 Tax=Nocardioides sp. TaxID=35761 RepID=UPI001A1C2060|nr:GNAT family N-acetyltransferase [Nocardioides sp.]MBJ7356804.1 GNAT family N-acetyltransferase [Nocardioides sp.]